MAVDCNKYIWQCFVLGLVILSVIAYCQWEVHDDPIVQDQEPWYKMVVKELANGSVGNLYVSTKHQTSTCFTVRSPVSICFSLFLLTYATFFLGSCIVSYCRLEVKGLATDCEVQSNLSPKLAASSYFKAGLIEVLDAILVTSPKSKKHKDHRWIFDLPEGWLPHPPQHLLYPAFDLLASYRPLAHSGSYTCKFSFTELAEAGFRYIGDGQVVSCTGCGHSVEMSHITFCPKDLAYHKAACRFVEESQCPSKAEDEMPGAASMDILQMDDIGLGKAVVSSELTNRVGKHENTVDNLFVGPVEKTEQSTPTGPMAQTGASATLGTNLSDDGRRISETQLGGGEAQTASAGHQSWNLLEPGPSEQRQRERARSGDSGVSADSTALDQTAQGARPKDHRATSCHPNNLKDGLFYDETTYRLEKMTSKPNLKESVFNHKCDKNPGHYAYFPAGDLNMEQLPSGVRHEAFLKMMRLLARLTVRIVVKDRSSRRLAMGGENGNYQVGTGSCLTRECMVHSAEGVGETSRKWASMKKYLPFQKKQYGVIYVETNSHVVSDETAAENAVVEFDFNHLDRKDVVMVKGVSVEHNEVLGVYSSTLVCHTTDLQLVDRLNRDRVEFWNLVRNLPADIHLALFGRVFIVGHPHGGEKIMANGKSMVIKYLLTTEKQSDKTVLGMKKISNNEKLASDTISQVRKTLIHTADSCMGMSGAPILSFKMTPDSGDGENGPVVVEPELWMHNGFDLNHELAGSVMKALTWEDIEQHGRPKKPVRPAVNENAGDGTNSFKAQVTGPVFTVIGRPSYPSYIAFDKRLDSFKHIWLLEHIQPGRHLAEAGFFFTGSNNCVRCFHCGLGLKGWQKEDDVYFEHYKHKPSCPFLLNKLRAIGITNPEAQFRHHQQSTAGVHKPGASQITSEVNDNSSDKWPLAAAAAGKSIATTTCLTGPLAFVEGLSKSCMPQKPEMTIGSATSGQKDLSAQHDNRLVLLQKENEILQKQLLCRVCVKNPVKDLFLPCGELYACSDCSKLLSICPSCLKPIKATVTTYFS